MSKRVSQFLATIALSMLVGIPASAVEITDDFSDNVVDPAIWAYGGALRCFTSANWWQWSVNEHDGYLQTRVWGPESGLSYGSEVWIRTQHNYNDGLNHIVNFTWGADVNAWHLDLFAIQIWNGETYAGSDYMWFNDDTEGLKKLFYVNGALSVPFGTGLQDTPPTTWSIYIDAASRQATLYSAADLGGSIIGQKPLAASQPWFINFIQNDATSSGFPAGDNSVFLYNYHSRSTSPSPLHGRIAYVVSSPNTLWVFDTDSMTSAQVPLDRNIVPSVGTTVWRPDGEWIVFEGGFSLNSQIYTVRPDGSGLRRITDGSGDLVNPAVSADGTKVAYQQVYGNVYISNFDGSGRIDTGYGIDMVGFSPDGTKMVGCNWAIAGGGYNSDLFIRDLAGGGLTKITSRPDGTAYVWPAWSPDGSKIAAVFAHNGQHDIVVLNPDGTRITNLTLDWTSDEHGQSWTPDGQYLLFTSNHDGDSGVWVMRPDGTSRQKLISGGAAYLSAPSFVPFAYTETFVKTGQPTLNGQARDAITLSVGETLAGSFPFRVANGPNPNAIAIGVVGYVNADNHWVSGTEPWVVYSGIPSQAGESRTASIPSHTVPASAGIYTLRYRAYWVTGNDEAVSRFKNNEEYSNRFGMVGTLIVAAPFDPNLGLLAYYPFDGDARDASGNGHSGTVEGAILASDRFGEANRAYEFAGVSERIVIPASPAFELRTNISISAWVKRGEVGHFDPILCKEDHQPNGTSHFHFRINTNGRLAFYFYIGAWAGGEATGVVADTAWHHVAVTYDGQWIRFFIDGQGAGEISETRGMWPAGEPLQVGEAQAAGFSYLKGIVDELRIYNRPLPGAEIQQLAYAESFVKTGQPTLNGQARDVITLNVGEALAGSFPFRVANGPNPNAIAIGVVGYVNADNHWVSGTEPWVVYSGIPSQAGDNGTANIPSHAVPASVGTYTLRYRAYWVTSNDDAINRFKNNEEYSNRFGNVATATVNAVPIANAQSGAAAEDAAVAITLTGSDLDGDSLTFLVVSGPSHGSLSGTPPSLTYTPAANYNGPDSFTFKVNDGTVDSVPATVSINVTPVNDPPVVKCKNQSVSAGAGCTADASIDDGSFDPDSGDTITLTQTPAGPYPLGATEVTLTVTDSFGASSTCTATVTVKDTTPPTIITCPTEVDEDTAPGQCSATVFYTVTATDECPGVDLVCTPPSGSVFQKGTTTVVCVATDAAGNSTTASFPVTVHDNEKPQLACPADITVSCDPALLVPVQFTVTASDNCDGQVPVVCTPPSGSGFPIGTTVVTCAATDSSGKTSTNSFTVTRAPLQFTGFLPPIGGADATGGSFAAPLRTFKMGSSIPVKFTSACGGQPVLGGVHRLQVTKYADQTTAGEPIDATPQDGATSGNQFRLSDGQWHFNLDTKGTGMSNGIWLLVATLSDGSQHEAWIQLK